ncbi:MAG: efflux transporter periplasmic adaptor subunit, partial [Lentisphaeria bacterium]|nr:efflux transporter periplasmic adaptor subunit [Lentisphaeria bacterium]
YVYHPEQKRVERREVKLGLRSRGQAEILAGLKEKELLVVDGVLKLVDGATVQVITDDPASGNGAK